VFASARVASSKAGDRTAPIAWPRPSKSEQPEDIYVKYPSPVAVWRQGGTSLVALINRQSHVRVCGHTTVVPSVSPDLVSKLVEEWRQCNHIARQAGISHIHRAALRALLRNTSTVQLQPPTDSSMQLAMPTRLPHRNASCRRTLQQCHTEHGPAHSIDSSSHRHSGPESGPRIQ
jgi:hypothetical protein